MQGDRGWAALDGRHNALNAIRLGLASLVIASHCWGMAYGFEGPLPYLGGFAVDGFFAISGYLITGSRLRLPLGEFLSRRALRILPGFWACLVVTALVLAPVVALVNGERFDAGRAASFITHNAGLVVTQEGVGLHALSSIEVQWNGPLWTLAYECGAYLIAGLLLSLPWFRAWAVAVTLAGCTIASLTIGDGQWTGGTVPAWARLGAFFAAGMLLRLTRPHLAAPLAGVAAAVVALGLLAPYRAYLAVAPLALAYLVLWAGATMRTRVGVRHDVSYGMYIYGWPTQLLLLVAGVPRLGLGWFVVLSVAATLPPAWASWLLVERPAMRLGRQSLGTIQATWSHQSAPSASRRFTLSG